MRESLRDVAIILLVLEAMVMLLVPLVATFAAARGASWLLRKLPPLFAQARRILTLVKLSVERASAAAVAPIIAANAAIAQLRAWRRYLAGLAGRIQEED